MPKDGLRRLPDHVVPLLLRALMSIPSRNDRLTLQRAEFGRGPGWHDEKDFNVIWRGRQVGRIHYFDRYDESERKGAVALVLARSAGPAKREGKRADA
jgi:hypothetical protein